MRICESCQVAGAADVCWCCGGPMRLARAGEVKWASSHTYTRQKDWWGAGPARFPIEDPEPASII